MPQAKKNPAQQNVTRDGIYNHPGALLTTGQGTLTLKALTLSFVGFPKMVNPTSTGCKFKPPVPKGQTA